MLCNLYWYVKRHVGLDDANEIRNVMTTHDE